MNPYQEALRILIASFFYLITSSERIVVIICPINSPLKEEEEKKNKRLIALRRFSFLCLLVRVGIYLYENIGVSRSLCLFFYTVELSEAWALNKELFRVP